MSIPDPTPRPPATRRPGVPMDLTDADQTAICEAALEIMASVGVRVLHPGAGELLAGAGAGLAGDQLVTSPRELVEQAPATAPAGSEVFAPASALSHPVESIDKLLFGAGHGIPAVCSPAPQAGGTAPITSAGQSAQGTAESLFGLVIHQLRRTGAPFLVGLTGSLEPIVLTDECIAMNRKLFAGVEATPETLAVDVVRDVGPGGDFLSHRQTARQVRKAQWRPTILNRQGHVRRLEDGGLDLRGQARREALRLLAGQEVAPLPEDAAARIDVLVAGSTPGA